MRTVIVTTTIHVPVALIEYRKKCDCWFIVIGDKKTPKSVKKFCKNIDRCEYLDVEAQEEYLNKFPELAKYLPYNSIQRRNIGLLLAYERGFDKIITIDDDNFLESKLFLELHQLGKQELNVIKSASGWYNVCKDLVDVKGREIFHRGYPLEVRDNPYTNTESKEVNVVVNAGLWLGEPDLDAMTRLYWEADPLESVYFNGMRFALEHGTWSPFNSQNTALDRKVIPAYFLKPDIGRYDDIWASYIVKKIADYLGDYIAYGEPLARQDRNEHDNWKDLAKETHLEDTLDFTTKLKDIQLTGRTYEECFKEIAESLNDKGLKVWVKTFQRLQ